MGDDRRHLADAGPLLPVAVRAVTTQGSAFMEHEAVSSDKAAINLRAHRDLFVACAAMVLAASLMHVDRQGNVWVPYASGPPLPSMCLMRTVLHTDCPTCGMTRSLVAAASGEYALAYAFHRLGPIFFVYVLLQVPLRAYALVTGRLGPLAFISRYSVPGIWAFVVALWLNWGYNVLTGAAFH